MVNLKNVQYLLKQVHHCNLANSVSKGEDCLVSYFQLNCVLC